MSGDTSMTYCQVIFGGFAEKYSSKSKWIIPPGFGVNIKNAWHHDLDIYTY